MIFTAQLISHEGVPLQRVTEDAHYQQLLKGKQIFYIVSTRLDGPAVSKFGIAHDAARRGWNIQRLRQYLKMYGAEHHDHSQKQSQKKQANNCHGARLHFLATTSYEATSRQMVADRYKHSTLVRLESYLKRLYGSNDASLKELHRGDERVRIKPSALIKQVLELKRQLPNQVDQASGRRRVLSRRAKVPAASQSAGRHSSSKSSKSSKSSDTYEITRFVASRPWRILVQWKGYSQPTWEPKATLRRDLGTKPYEALLTALALDGTSGASGASGASSSS
jgi:hypothetical protein